MIRTELNTVLFDLDGTIVEHSHAVLPPLLAEWGFVRNLEQVKTAFTVEIHWFYEHVLDAEEQGWVPELYRQLYARVLQRMVIPDADGSRVRAIGDFYAAHPVPPLFDDVPPVLGELAAQEWRLGMITQRGREGVDRFLDEHGLTAAFDVVIAGDDGYGRKPTPHPFQAALSALGALPEQAVYVGDRIDDDCEGATAAGLAAFLIDRDAAHAEAACNRSDFVYLNHMAQLLDHLPACPALSE